MQNGGDWWTQSVTFRVRGQSNLSNTSAALVLIDGFERSLAAITVAEIESISVLKDASALALYGQRGANGVILVTTKRGIEEGLSVDVSYERSFNQPFRLPQMLDAYGYANAMNEALFLDGQDYLYTKEQLDAYKDGTYPDYYSSVNWFDEALREYGYIDDFNATFRGGKGRTRYFVSMNYLGGEGLLDQSLDMNNYSTQLNYGRANIRTNLDIELTKTTMLKFNLAGRVSGTNRPGKATSANLFSNLYNIPSNAFPVYYSDGLWGGSPTYTQNPIAEVYETGYATSHERTYYADLTLTQDLKAITEGLSASASVSFDNNVSYWDQKTRDFVYSYRTADIDEINGLTYNEIITDYGENTALAFNTSFGGQLRRANSIFKLNYDKQWGLNSLNATALFHANSEVGDGQNTTYHRINNAGLVNYSYNNKYFAGLTMSYSGNNILPEEDHFRFYPAVSMGWMISKESFMENVGAVDYLKLRASTGLVGLEPDVFHLHIPKFSGGQNYLYTDENESLGGLEENRRANPDIDPEKAFISNIGLDAKVFGKLRLNIDAFYEKRSEILVSESNSTSNVIGVASTQVTDGIVENKGVEVSALWSNSVGEFKYSFGAQSSFARNKIIEQNETFREWDYLERTGLPVGQIFGLQDDGLWGTDDGLSGIDNVSPNGVLYTFTQVLKPGDVKYVDQNGDDRIDEFDVIAIGHNTLPEISYSFTLNLEYKGLGVDALFQGVSNVSQILNTAGIFWPLYNNNNITSFSNDRWTPATQETATLPRLTPENNDNNYRNSTIWLRDASFLKLRTLQIYYQLPENVLKNMKLERSTVFLRGHNLFSIDEIQVVDPEETGKVYPTLRSFNVGLSVGF